MEREGWLLPIDFGSSVAEYEAVRSRAGILDLCHRAILEFTGPDRLSYLQGMISNDLKPLTPGQGVYATFLNVQGKVLGDCRVLCMEDSFLIDLWEPIKQKILDHLNRYLVADEVEISDLNGRYGILSIQGPQSGGLLRGLTESAHIPQEPLQHSVVHISGAEVRVMRFSHTGEEGFDFVIPVGELDRLAWHFTEAAKVFAARWVGEEAQESLRVEAGIPRYGVDFSEETLLLEVGLAHAVSFTKGCYLGQEVVERIRSRGHVNKKLCGLVLDGREPARFGDAIRASDKVVGSITSSIYSPSLGRTIALGYVHKDAWAPGTNLLVTHNGSSINATVVELPFLTKRELRSSS